MKNNDLIDTAKVGNYEAVLSLIKAGTEVNKADKEGRTPLYWVAYNGRKEVAALLLENGAEVNKVRKNGETPLLVAARYGHKEVVALLLENGGEVNKADKGGRTPLFWAAYNGRKEVVALLLENGGEVNKVDKAGETPLLVAARYGHKEVVALLLENGGEVNKADNEGQTPLVWAAGGGSKKLIALLLENGAEVNKADLYGRTPLSSAAYHNYKEVVALLLRYSAIVREENMKAVNYELKSSLIQAKYLQELINLLQANPAAKLEMIESEVTKIMEAVNYALKSSLIQTRYPQEFIRLLQANPTAKLEMIESEVTKIINDTPQDSNVVVPLSKLCASEFVADTIKGMIFTKLISRQAAQEFISQVMQLATPEDRPEALVQLYKELSYNTDALLDMVNVLAVVDLFKEEEITGKISMPIEEFTKIERASYYDSLKDHYQSSAMNEEELRQKYPHPLDTEVARKFLGAISPKDKAVKIAKQLVSFPHLAKEIEGTLEHGLLSREDTTLFREVLVQKSAIEASTSSAIAASAAASISAVAVATLPEYCDDEDLPIADNSAREASQDFVA
jgi:ankyrin repeat protein